MNLLYKGCENNYTEEEDEENEVNMARTGNIPQKISLKRISQNTYLIELFLRKNKLLCT